MVLKLSKNIQYNDIEEVVGAIFEDMHQKRRLSLANAAFGVLKSNSLLLHKMGEGLARGKGLTKKHTTKQIDRLLSNDKLSMWNVSKDWVPYVIGARSEIKVAIDWTSFANDDQQTVCLNLLTSHGRATPLLWKTVEKMQLKNNRARYEDQLLSRLKSVLPENVKVTIVADRGFADQKFFEFLSKELGFDYVIRIKSSTTVISEEEVKKASDWLRANGRASSIKLAKITKARYQVGMFVSVKDKLMKGAWLLVTNKEDMQASQVIDLYSKRWKIEPYFRDIKDSRFGFALRQTQINNTERRDRLLLIVSICYVLLNLLGAAGESIGFDKFLKVNTVKTRTHSLIRQGIFYYEFFDNFKPLQQEQLLSAFNDLLAKQPIWHDVFFVI